MTPKTLARAHLMGVLFASLKYVFDEAWCQEHLGMSCLPGHDSPEEMELIKKAYTEEVYALHGLWFPSLRKNKQD